MFAALPPGLLPKFVAAVLRSATADDRGWHSTLCLCSQGIGSLGATGAFADLEFRRCQRAVAGFLGQNRGCRCCRLGLRKGEGGKQCRHVAGVGGGVGCFFRKFSGLGICGDVAARHHFYRSTHLGQKQGGEIGANRAIDRRRSRCIAAGASTRSGSGSIGGPCHGGRHIDGGGNGGAGAWLSLIRKSELSMDEQSPCQGVRLRRIGRNGPCGPKIHPAAFGPASFPVAVRQPDGVRPGCRWLSACGGGPAIRPWPAAVCCSEVSTTTRCWAMASSMRPMNSWKLRQPAGLRPWAEAWRKRSAYSSRYWISMFSLALVSCSAAIRRPSSLLASSARFCISSSRVAG